MYNTYSIYTVYQGLWVGCIVWQYNSNFTIIIQLRKYPSTYWLFYLVTLNNAYKRLWNRFDWNQSGWFYLINLTKITNQNRWTSRRLWNQYAKNNPLKQSVLKSIFSISKLHFYNVYLVYSPQGEITPPIYNQSRYWARGLYVNRVVYILDNKYYQSLQGEINLLGGLWIVAIVNRFLGRYKARKIYINWVVNSRNR